MNNINLYHYSKQLYPVLKTIKQTGIDYSKIHPNRPVPEPVKGLGDYTDHISFFFDVIPYDILGDIFKKEFHDAWYKGSMLYEYTVNVKSLPEFKYDIVESPTITDIFYDPKYDYMSKEEYFKLIYSIKLKSKEIGFNKNDFISVANKYKGLAREAFLKLPSRENWEQIKYKYGPTVPHVMLYPSEPVKYKSYRKIVIGSSITEALNW